MMSSTKNAELCRSTYASASRLPVELGLALLTNGQRAKRVLQLLRTRAAVSAALEHLKDSLIFAIECCLL